MSDHQQHLCWLPSPCNFCGIAKKIWEGQKGCECFIKMTLIIVKKKIMACNCEHNPCVCFFKMINHG